MNMNMNPNSELQQSVVSVPDLVQVPEDLLNQAKEIYDEPRFAEDYAMLDALLQG